MKMHVLAGDALAEDFKLTEIGGEIVVCRECLIEGDLRAETLEGFWTMRERFIKKTYGADDYREKVVREFEKVQNLSADTEVYLWFEYELFCQANMWFCLALLQNTRAQIYRVAPAVRAETEIWKGFGNLGKADLERCFAGKVEFSKEEIRHGAKLWEAFRNKNAGELEKLGAAQYECFPKLAEVCRAATEIETRPVETLKKISATGETNFENVFAQFAESEGAYGFGDAQVKRILQTVWTKF